MTISVRRLSYYLGVALVLAFAGSSAADSPTTGMMTLTAGIIEVTPTEVTARESPSLVSPQGTISAPEFLVKLDSKGVATRAVARGGVQFTLTAVTGAYRELTGACNELTVFPATKHAVLDGNLTAVLSGPKTAPMRLDGAHADLYAAKAGSPAHIEISSARSEIPTHL